MKLTYKYLILFINEQFKKFGIVDYEVTQIWRTYYRRDEYEAGASKMQIIFKNNTLPTNHFANFGHFMCFYSLRELEQQLKNGYELYLKFDRFHILSNLQLDVRRNNIKDEVIADDYINYKNNIKKEK
jgi:hypothetical protein